MSAAVEAKACARTFRDSLLEIPRQLRAEVEADVADLLAAAEAAAGHVATCDYCRERRHAAPLFVLLRECAARGIS